MINGPTNKEEFQINRDSVVAKVKDLAEGARGGIEMVTENLKTEEIHVTGDAIVAKVKELVHEGNVRRIIIKNEAGHVLAEFPLTAGVVGVVLLPMWAALGAVVALVANCTIIVERAEEPPRMP